MNWEDAIPSIAIAEAARATEPAMDSDRFAAFYERSSRPLWAYLARASGDPALADDLMQESYVRFLSGGSGSRRRGCRAPLPLSHRKQSAARPLAPSAYPPYRRAAGGSFRRTRHLGAD